MPETFTLYKFMILYMLSRVDFPLTNAQISEFVLDQGYTTYFTLQQIIHDLLDAELIREEKIRTTSRYYITDSGEKTLEFFGNKISPAIRRDIDSYLKENQFQLRNQVSIVADYYKTTTDEYTAECKVQEKNVDLISLSLTVPLKEQAIAICDHWNSKCQEIYTFVMNELLQ